jgi:L-rhamnose mutarotase
MQEWEALMWKYQKPVSGARPGEKWVLMEKIFEIKKLVEQT